MSFARKLAQGLTEVANVRDPDLAWKFTAVDLDQGDGDTRPAELRGLVAPLDDGHPLEAASLPDPDHTNRAA